jgi:hypothetical protein
MIEAIGQRGGPGVPGGSAARPKTLLDGFPAAAERALAAAAGARAHGVAGRRAEAVAWHGGVDGASAAFTPGMIEPERPETAMEGPGAAGESAPAANAAVASAAAVRVSISRGEGGRAELDLRVGDWLHVRLYAGERGVAITIGCDPAVAPLLERALPRLLRHLRARGVAVARAEVVPFSRAGRGPPR